MTNAELMAILVTLPADAKITIALHADDGNDSGPWARMLDDHPGLLQVTEAHLFEENMVIIETTAIDNY